MLRGASPGKAVRVGIIGFGSQGKLHYEGLWAIPPFEVVWVFDRNAQRTAELPKSLRVRSFAEALLRDTQIVAVATPPPSHFEIARFWLQAGRNIVVEKPTTIHASETHSLLDAAERLQLFILTHFNRRWDPDFLAVRNSFKAFDFGRVHEIESRVTDPYALDERYPNRKAWKLRSPGGGILLDWAPHLFDQLFEIMGAKVPRSIYCCKDRPNRIVRPDLEEQFTIHVRYRDCLAILGASWNSGLPRPRWGVWGTRAALRVDRLGETGGTIRWRSGDEVRTEGLKAFSEQSASELFRELVLSALRSPSTRAREARRIARVSSGIDLARRSYLEGKPVPWELS